jgi:hypothetical protein
MSKLAILSAAVAFAGASFCGCEGNNPAEPVLDASTSAFGAKSLADAEVRGNAGDKVEVCHRTQGVRDFILISVARPSVEVHLAHGDGLIGAEVPGQPGMVFDSECEPVPSRRVITVTGQWDGTSYHFYGLFTVAYEGPVDAVATVTGYSGLMRVGLLGYKAGEPSSCSTYWLPKPIPPGPAMNTPVITGHFDDVPPGTYCLNVVKGTTVPPYPPPYSWTVSITYP